MSSIWLKCLILLWWLCNTSYHFQNIRLYDEHPRSANWAIFSKYLRFLEMSMLQCFAGAATAALLLKLAKRKPLVFSVFRKKILALVVLGHLTGTLAINAAVSMHSLYIRDLFRCFEPVMVYVLLMQNGYNIRNGLYVFLGLVLMSTGLHTFMRHQNLVFTQWGVIAAIIPLLMFPLRNVYLKVFGETWKDPVEKYLVVSVCSFLVLLPVVLIKLAYTRIVPLLSPEMALQSVTFHVVDSLISIFFLEMFSPVFHSVLGTLIKYSINILTVMYLSVPMSWFMAFGMVLFLVGLVIYYQKYNSSNVYEIKRFVITSILTMHLIFGLNILWKVQFNTKSTAIKQPFTVIHTFWVYNQPLSRDILLNMRKGYPKTSTNKLHVFCGTFSCLRKVRRLTNPQISTTLLTFNEIVRNSPLEQWFKAHSVHKILSRNHFEAHLHEATRLALLWRYGGTIVDPFLRIREKSFRELVRGRDSWPWVTKIKNDNLSGIFYACRFKKRHPFVKILSNIFVKLYYRQCYLKQYCKTLNSNFHAQSRNALVDFCSKNSQNCPKTVEIVAQRTNHEIHSKHFDITFESFNTKFLSTGIQNLATIQFFPFVERFTSSNATLARTWNNTSVLQEPKTHFLPKFEKPFYSSTSLEESLAQRKDYSLEYIASLRRNAPIGCLDMKIVNYLRSHNVEAYLSGGISLLMKSPLSFGTARKDIYIVNLNKSIIEQLPRKIQDHGLSLSLGKKNELSLRSLFKSTYVFLKKIARAKLVITADFHCASVAVTFDTPVLFVKTQGASNTTQDALQVFHTWDANNRILNSSDVMLISKLLSGKIPAVADLSLLMRLRGTTWSEIRRYESVRESALKFGIVPFTRSRSNTVESAVFHLIFTTSEQSLITLEDHTRTSRVKGSFVWRHWRCVESIFYHNPLATVVVHSNTLSSRIFDVLRESGYEIQVKPYSLTNLAKGTPADVFVRDELPYAQEGEHWYSHETDLLRLLILYKFGGIYMDIDMIIVRELHDLPSNIIGWESTSNLNGAFLKFQKHHPYLHACIKRFSNRYAQAWSENGPLLLSRVWREWSTANPDNDVITVAPTAFYMFFYRSIQKQCFEDTSGVNFAMNWRILKSQAYAVHLYSKVTASYGNEDRKIKDGTLCKYILNTFCVLCIKIY